MAYFLDLDHRLWLTYQLVFARLTTRRTTAAVEREQVLLEDLEHPTVLDAATASHLREQLDTLSQKAGVTLSDLLRWALLHMNFDSNPRALILDALRLEQLLEAVEWQQRRLDALIHSQLNPDLVPTIPDGDALRTYLRSQAVGTK